ncbi:MAG: hypothetical protein RL653_1832 [Pseudomonadota bacterium]|jgi:ABC-type phosphate transport system substrate-binding protein
MNRIVLSSAACVLALGLVACGNGGTSNPTPDAGASTQDAGSAPKADGGTSPTPDAGTTAPDAGTGFNPGLQYNGSIAFEKVTQ